MMNPTIPLADIPRQPVFKAVTVGLLVLYVIGLVIALVTQPGPQDMMVPWLRPVGMMQLLLSAACLILVWFRQGWAFYITCGLVLFDILLGLSLGRPWPLLLVSPVLFGLYLWALHVGGTHSMWRQMFGAAAQAGPGVAYGFQPARPPQANRPASVSAPPPAPLAPPPSIVAHSSMDAAEKLKRLGALRDAGVITPQEFDTKKADLLRFL